MINSYITITVITELKRVEQGGSKKVIPTVEAHHNRPQGIALRVRIPLHEFPKVSCKMYHSV